MAVRVRLHLEGPAGGQVEGAALLNGGFEMPTPHVLLPLGCAKHLFADPTEGARRSLFDVAATTVEFWVLPRPLTAHVRAGDRQGPRASLDVLVSETEREILVSDAGIDALGVRIESFHPGRWRLADEVRTRDTENAELW